MSYKHHSGTQNYICDFNIKINRVTQVFNLTDYYNIDTDYTKFLIYDVQEKATESRYE